ncbi:WD40-like Beta Propeller [Sesbania bispinosa]|nr:WD40-like Beta Propeller [Sesbania bispinosa]
MLARMVGVEGMKPNAQTLASVLPTCARMQWLCLGKELHGYIVRHEFFSNAFVVNALVDMYRRCGEMKSAFKMFSKFARKCAASYNAIIAGYCENGNIIKAKELFDQMEQEGVERNRISWNCIISGYVDNFLFDEALRLFHGLLKEGIEPDSFTLGSVLTGCADMASIQLGKEIHSHAIVKGLQSNCFVGGALVEMYCKCQEIVAAQKAFDEISERDLATWNALISGYARSNQIEKIGELLKKMKGDGFEPNVYTWNGTIVFNTVGRVQYGFDVFSINLDHHHHPSPPQATADLRLTDGISINFNAQFVDDEHTVVFVSERTGSPRFYLTRPGIGKPQPLPSAPNSLFHDRPTIKNGKLYFASAQEQPDPVPLFKSWSAVYSVAVDGTGTVKRFTPHGTVDYSPAVSLTGKFVAVASYGSRSWRTGDFRELETEITVFPESDPENRVTVSERGGWPTWSRDSTIFFHRIAEDGWWSIFRVNLPDSNLTGSPTSPVRVTPPDLHCFTPAAMHDGKRIVVATRRRGNNFRHIEIFDLESQTFQKITESINPSFHHYNPFVSLDSRHLGYHRFRGESTQGESTYPHLDPVMSPVPNIQLLRLNGSFPSFSLDGDYIAFNHDFDSNGGVKIIRSNGSKRWTLLKGRTCFYNAWNPTEKGVIYTSIGPIFESASKTVQIARIEFDPVHLTDDRDEIPFTLKLLTGDGTGNNAFPSCSPDGKSIVFRSGRSGHKNLYIVDAVNGELNGGLRRLTEGEWIDTMPSWSPKGDLIAFSSNRHDPRNSEVFGIYVVRPDGSGLRRIEVAKGEDAEREKLNHVCFSGDGEWLLFTANLGGVTAEPVSMPNQFQPYGDLHVVRLDGSGLRRLTCNAYENGTPAWHGVSGVQLLRSRDGGEDVLKGGFEEPLWITCDN